MKRAAFRFPWVSAAEAEGGNISAIPVLDGIDNPVYSFLVNLINSHYRVQGDVSSLD